MKSKILKSIAATAAICMLAGSFAGCGNNGKTQTSNSGTTELSYWVELDASTAQTVTELGETEFAKQLQEDTGVKLKFIHPPQGQAAEKFNIMIVSNDLPDIMEYNWTSAYAGGPEKAITDGYILKLNELMEQKAPNLTKYLNENDDVDNAVKTDSGYYFGFPFIRGDKTLQVSAGLVLRQDWLNDLGLEVPTTISEWKNVLQQFKDKKGASAPLSMAPNGFVWACFVDAYNTTRDFYIDNGKVVYGPAEPQYKDFLKEMNDWYKEGLLDNSIATVDSKMIETNILNGYAGATATTVGGGIGKLMAARPNDKFELVAAPFPTLNKGDYPEFGHMQLKVPNTYAAISAKSKNIDAAMKFLDYGYSEKGHMLYNFGIEGESYNMVDNYPKYTDYITKNPEGLAMSAAMSHYMRSHVAGPFVQDIRYMEQYAALPAQQDAWKKWSDTNMEKHILPQLYFQENEIKEMASILNAVRTYESEQFLKFIMGVEPVDNFDAYVKEMNSRGLDKLLAAYQSAYERYLNR